jgi:hypothetical protein
MFGGVMPGRDAQDRIVLRADLRDGAADVGALREIDRGCRGPGSTATRWSMPLTVVE